MTRLVFALLFVALAAGPCGAQAEKPKPALTELETAQAQVLTLQRALVALSEQLSGCQAQLAPVQARANSEALAKLEADLVARIEAAHPGLSYDVRTGQLTPKAPATPQSATVLTAPKK